MNNKLFIFAFTCMPILHGAATSSERSPLFAKLIKAAKGGDLPSIQALIANGADIYEHEIIVQERGTQAFHLRTETKGSLPIHFAAEHNHAHIVDYFLTVHNMHPSVEGWAGNTALHFACRSGSAETVALLLAQPEIEINRQSRDCNSPLLLACHKGDVAIVQQLVARGANINVVGKGGLTPFLAACWHGYADIATVLLDNKADATATTILRSGEHQAIHIAAMNGHIQIIELLAQQPNFEPDRLNEKQQTPLQIAAIEHEKDISIAKVLLKLGADIEARTGAGATPLHSACIIGNVDLVELLLASGADMHARAKDTTTPLGFAIIKGRLPVVQALFAHEVDPIIADDFDAALNAIIHSSIPNRYIYPCLPHLLAKNMSESNITKMLIFLSNLNSRPNNKGIMEMRQTLIRFINSYACGSMREKVITDMIARSYSPKPAIAQLANEQIRWLTDQKKASDGSAACMIDDFAPYLPDYDGNQQPEK